MNKDNGITLIALVITIIILLILAVVTINLTTGENGLFKLALQASEETQISDEKEKIQLAYTSAKLRTFTGTNFDRCIEEELTKQIGNKNEVYTLEKIDNEYLIKFIKTNRTYSIDGNGKFLEYEPVEDVEGYLLKWNVGYNSLTPLKASSSVVAFIVPNENNSDEYTLVFKGKGQMCSPSYWIADEKTDGWLSPSETVRNYKTKITKAIFEEGITNITTYTLYRCSQISDIDFGSTVVIKDRVAVSDATIWLNKKKSENPIVQVNNCLVDGKSCTGAITIPNNIKIICSDAFFANTDITSIQTEDNIVEIGSAAFQGCRNLTTFHYSESLLKIGNSAFKECTALQNIYLPEGLQEIGQSAFCSNTGLTCSKIKIPSTVKIIGNDYEKPNNEFYDCGKADTFVEFEVPNTSLYYKAIDGILYTKDGSTLISIPKGKTFTNNTYIMPDTVNKLGLFSFSTNKNINTLVLSDNLIVDANYLGGTMGNSLHAAIGAYPDVYNYEVKDTNTHYTTGNRVIERTGEFGDKVHEGYLLTIDETELVAMPAKGIDYYRMLTYNVTTIRKNAFYNCFYLVPGAYPYATVDNMYSGVYFRIAKNTVNIDAGQLSYINWLAKSSTSYNNMHLQIQGNDNDKYEIVDNQLIEKTNI